MSLVNLAEDATGLQRDLHAALSNDLAIQALLGDPVRAFDHVPDPAIYPYLTYGRIRSEDTSGDAAPQSTHQITLHLWSRNTGRSEVLAGLRQIERAARDGVPHIVTTTYADVFLANDGHTFHGLLRLSVTLFTELL